MAPSPRPRSRRRRLGAASTTALALTGLIAAGGTVAGPSTAVAATEAECTASGFCEDFESQSGTQPSGRWSFQAENCTGTGTVSVDSSVAHTGAKSMRINGGGGYCNHAFVGTELDSGTGSTTYLRFWVRHTTALPAAHVTFAAMNDANDNGKDLRMGGQNAALQWNRESDDATLPEQSPNGVSMSMPLPVNTWTCIEAKVDGSAGLLETWVDGEVVEGLVVDGTPTHDIDGQWLNKSNWRPSLTDLRLGWESYGGDTNTLWFDDVAVGNTPIGC